MTHPVPLLGQQVGVRPSEPDIASRCSSIPCHPLADHCLCEGQGEVVSGAGTTPSPADGRLTKS